MVISYAVTVSNEFIEIQRLLAFLLKHKRDQDEIVVLVDLTKNLFISTHTKTNNIFKCL